MKNFIQNILKVRMASVVALVVIATTASITIIALYHKPADKDISVLVIGQIYALAAFVIGYYFNKKSSHTDETQ